VFRVRLLDSLSSEERLSRSLRSVFKVRSLPRGLERVRVFAERESGVREEEVRCQLRGKVADSARPDL